MGCARALLTPQSNPPVENIKHSKDKEENYTTLVYAAPPHGMEQLLTMCNAQKKILPQSLDTQ